MKKVLKSVLSLLVCVVMVFGFVSNEAPTETVEARTLFDVEKELNEYKALLSSLQSELSSISKNISELEGKSGQTAKLMAQYQAEIDVLETDIEVNTAIMESYDEKRAKVISDIAVVKEDYDYRVSMYKKLMQFIYENSETNAFELLFSAENFSDYLTRRDNFNDIMNAANDLIKEIEISLADLKVLEEELAQTQAKYSEYLSGLNKSKTELETKIEEYKTIANELNLDANELEKKYKDKNAKVQEVKAKIKKLENERKEIFNSNATFIWPVKTSSYRVTSQYGWRGDPFGKPNTEYHKGIDIACSRGTPIVAVKAGVVTRASWYSGYGNCVIIYHGNGISSLYAHCDNGTSSRPTYEVKVGDSVKAGQVIAYVGTTGRSTGYHLHFGVVDTNISTALGGNYANPNKYLPDGYYTKRN